MKKAVKLLIVAIFVFAIATPIKAGIPDGAVLTKCFATTLKDPNQINIYNAENDLGNGLKAVMLLGSGNQTYLAVYKVGSGKRDIYLWDGNQWVYQYSITNIVPGFEEPQTLNSYKYATWSDYAVAIHKVDTGNENVVALENTDTTGTLLGQNTTTSTSSFTVALTGPTTGTITEKTKVRRVLNSITLHITNPTGQADYTVYPGDPIFDAWEKDIAGTGVYVGTDGSFTIKGDYDYDTYTYIQPFKGTYTVSISGFGATSVSWSVSPDGTVISNGTSASISWDTPGTKIVTAIVKDSLGNIVTKTLTVVVN